MAISQAKTPSGIVADQPADVSELACLKALERKILWLSSWMIHHANHERESRDGLKVGGHQASSASLATIMTALYLAVLRPQDRVAVKPHASPIFHAIQYLLGNQTKERLQSFRKLGGAQAYPSRTKDRDDVDFSTGSVGLGAAVTLFAALVQDYVALKSLLPEENKGRMVALVGDAELDEGNIFEALLEGWKHDVRDLWWIIDYNRQSLDSVVNDRLFQRIDKLFEMVGWRVITLKYGKKLEAAFAQADGEHLRQWIDECPNSLYSALVYKGGAAWREALQRDLNSFPGVRRILETHDDAALSALMTNLAGHDLECVLQAFRAAAESDVPTCFIAYTIKGINLPFAGHKDNHAGLMSPEQMREFRRLMQIDEGHEWDRFAGLDMDADRLEQFLKNVPFNASGRRRFADDAIEVPPLVAPATKKSSTQQGFGQILNELAGGESKLAQRIVTTSPDVTVSTNLGAWVNRRGVFNRQEAADVFREQKVVSAQRWHQSPRGQHIELGIAENNLFLQLAALGLSESLFGARLLPIGTLYDPFIQRGLDALNYACYQGARFMLVATPSGITLSPEGGAHQSISTPLIGMAQPGMTSFEPAFLDELAAIMEWGFGHMQADEGGSVYLRLSTRALDQPQRSLSTQQRNGVVNGAYWLRQPAQGAKLAIAYVGAVAPEAIAAHDSLLADIPEAGLLAVTSPDRLHEDWQSARQAGSSCHIGNLLGELAQDAALITVLDGHPATLSWLGSVAGQRIYPLGVDSFGQSGDVPDLYRVHRIDEAAIIDAAARACIDGWRP
ncbi:MAG: 1-deoxy-D-xylulose-5-phosphate synthase N-terminal domain-containing protein [Reyranellaceae bacterium]